MEILDNKSIISQTVPRIIESPGSLVINTHVYDKATFKPIPFEFNIVDIALPFSILSKNICTYDDATASRTLFLHSGNEKNQRIFQDTTNSDVFYFVSKYQNQGVKFIKFKKNGNNISEQWSYMYNEALGGQCGQTVYGSDIHLLYQSDLHILYVQKNPYRAGGWDGGGDAYSLRKYNKQTNEITSISSFNQGVNYPPLWNVQFLEFHNDNVYYMSSTSNKYAVTKVNLATNVTTKIFEFTNTDGLNVISNPVKIGDYYYIISDNYLQSGIHEYCFYKFKLDIATDTVARDVVSINLNGFTLDTAPGEVLSGIGEGIYHTLNTIEANGKNYIICTIHSTPNQNYYPNQHKLVVFEVADNEIIVKDVTTFSNGCKGVLEYINSNTLVFLYTDSIAFYKFDKTKERYVRTYRKPGIYNTIGFDTLNRFYMQHNTNAIEVITSMNACTLSADFAEEYYTNINVDTEISYYAKNFLDEYLNADVKITLIGPVEFKDDKSKTKITKTSINGLKTLPVTITGSGRIEVIITQLT